MSLTETDVMRCSAWTRSQDVDPVGSAGYYQGFLVVEVPLPWPRDASMIPRLAPVVEALEGTGIRLQASVPVSPDRPARLILHRADASGDDSWFRGYHRTEIEVEGEMGPAVAAALTGSGAAVSEVADLLVCTHGKRDVCCGSQGTALALELVAEGRLPSWVQLRRTSHTGGHRFAPTFLLLPQGTMWAFADADLVHRVLDRSVPFRELAGHYRGCAGIGSAPLQALERSVLCEAGWELLDEPRRAFATGDHRSDGAVHRLETAHACWEATVAPGRVVPVPDCMGRLGDARKTDTEWVVSGVRLI